MFSNPLLWFIKHLVTSTLRGRLRVDVGQTGFWEGREFRLNLPLTISTTNVVALRVTSPIDFVLQLQTLSVSETGMRFTAYRSTQGVESGTWTPVSNLLPNNSMSDTPPYTPQITVDTGGTFTVNGGEEPVETIELLTANSTAQQATVSGNTAKERGLPANTYYLLFSTYAGSGTAKVFTI